MSKCMFCENFDFRTARAAKTSTGSVHIEIAGGNTKFNSTETFNYCPVCGNRVKDHVYRWISGMEVYDQWVGYTILKLLQAITIHPDSVPADAKYAIKVAESCDSENSELLTENDRIIGILQDYPSLFDATIKKVERVDNTFVLTVGNISDIQEVGME